MWWILNAAGGFVYLPHFMLSLTVFQLLFLRLGSWTVPDLPVSWPYCDKQGASSHLRAASIPPAFLGVQFLELPPLCVCSMLPRGWGCRVGMWEHMDLSASFSDS